jgi:hypothetical protein
MPHTIGEDWYSLSIRKTVQVFADERIIFNVQRRVIGRTRKDSKDSLIE